MPPGQMAGRGRGRGRAVGPQGAMGNGQTVKWMALNG